MTLLRSRFAEHASRAPISAASLLLVTFMVPAAPMLSTGRLHQRRALKCEDLGGEGAVKCLAGHSSRRTFVTVHKIKGRTGDDWMMSERRVVSHKNHRALRR